MLFVNKIRNKAFILNSCDTSILAVSVVYGDSKYTKIPQV